MITKVTTLREKFKPVNFGLLLSHALGFLIFFQICLSRLVSNQLPGHDEQFVYPIRALAVFLVIRGIGQRRPYRPTMWDYVYLSFFCANLFGAIAIEFFMIKRMVILANVNLLMSFGDNFLYYFVLREGLGREGFSLKVLMSWWGGTFMIAMIIAWSQVTNIGGFGNHLDSLVNQAAAEAAMDGPGQKYMARGLLAHPNALASQMPFVIALAFGALYENSRRPLFWILLVSAVVTCFWSYSRTGLLVLFILGFAYGVFLLARRRTTAGFSVLGFAVVLVAIGISLIFALDLKKYKEIFVRKQTSTSAADVSVKRRAEMSSLAIRTATDYSPIFGVMAADPGIQTIHGISQNAYNPRLVIFGQYANLYLRYGFVGLAWLAGLLICMFSFILPAYQAYPYAISGFIAGLSLAIHGIAESLSTDVLYMINVNLLVALAITVRSNRSTLAAASKKATWTGLIGGNHKFLK
jgi:O-Antigen ligase